MKLTLLYSGFPGRSSRGFLGWSSCVLIEQQGKKPMLYDTVGFNERNQLIEKLANHKLSVEDIGAVFLSHFHFDHAVNFGLFPNATFYLHEAEVTHIEACRHNNYDLAVPYEMFQALKETNRLILLHGEEGVAEEIQWMHTPGHTPGLYSLFVKIQSKIWGLVSDTVKTQEELETGTVSMSLDNKQSEASIRKLIEKADVVVPGHDAPLSINKSKKGRCIEPLSTPEMTIYSYQRSKVHITHLER